MARGFIQTTEVLHALLKIKTETGVWGGKGSVDAPRVPRPLWLRMALLWNLYHFNSIQPHQAAAPSLGFFVELKLLSHVPPS